MIELIIAHRVGALVVGFYRPSRWKSCAPVAGRCACAYTGESPSIIKAKPVRPERPDPKFAVMC